MNVEQYMDNLVKGSKNPSLNGMKYFMKEYDNFEKKMKFIHIAGTNGKGSCVEMISKILKCQGYKVGRFISPHLITYNEMITINGKEISNEEMEQLIKELEPKIEKYKLIENKEITLFECETIIALLYFYRNNVDFIVLETGRGGLEDCTNIISNPLISVISSIGYDHMKALGNTLPEIASKKAGIIKENSNTVFFEQTQDVNQVFIDICKEKNNKLHLIKEEQINNCRHDNKYQYFDCRNYKDIAIILKGEKQFRNAAVCIECMNILNELGYKISEESIREGLKTVIHRARMEILNKNPLIIFDGAHNEPAIENLKSTVDMYYKNVEKTYVVSILKTKDYSKMLKILMEDEEAEFIFTSGIDEKRYVSKEELFNIGLNYKENQKIRKMTLNDAIEYTLKNNKVNFIVGSFYVYANVVKKLYTLC